MMEIWTRVDGIWPLMDQLSALERVLRGQIVATGIKAAAMTHTEARWKRTAPVDTGSYRRSIHTVIEDASWDYCRVVVGTDIIDPPYPWFLEVGTSRMSARPSARPAFDSTKNLVERDAIRFVNYQIDRVVS